MKRSWLWTATGALALATTTSIATIAILTQDSPPAGVATATLHSRQLGESRDYVVHLPASYRCDPQRRYAVAYVLDAGPQFTTMVQSSSLLARLGLAAELIVVGIPSPNDASRQRDYTPPGMRQDVDVADSPPGEADRFLGFIRDELIVEIERRYRSNHIRILSGHCAEAATEIVPQHDIPAAKYLGCQKFSQPAITVFVSVGQPHQIMHIAMQHEHAGGPREIQVRHFFRPRRIPFRERARSQRRRRCSRFRVKNADLRHAD